MPRDSGSYSPPRADACASCDAGRHDHDADAVSLRESVLCESFATRAARCTEDVPRSAPRLQATPCRACAAGRAAGNRSALACDTCAPGRFAGATRLEFSCNRLLRAALFSGGIL